MIFKVQKRCKNQFLESSLTKLMQESFSESFRGDYNMIIEEFDFYQHLPPKMQSQLIEQVF